MRWLTKGKGEGKGRWELSISVVGIRKELVGSWDKRGLSVHISWVHRSRRTYGSKEKYISSRPGLRNRSKWLAPCLSTILPMINCESILTWDTESIGGMQC